VIFTTRIGERVMRRNFGSDVPGLLGRPLAPSTLLRFWTAIIIAVELWEPRFRVIQIVYPDNANTPEAARTGGLALQVTGQYRPNALHGDFTPESARTYRFAEPAPASAPAIRTSSKLSLASGGQLLLADGSSALLRAN
jgi:phage baseplate assembly protein W